MSLGRLADLLRSRGLSWTFRASGGTCESIVRGPGDSHVYAVNSVSIEHAIGRTIAALGASSGLHFIRLPDAATPEELQAIATAAGCGPVLDPHLGPDGRWRGAAVLLKKSTDETDSSP